MTIKSHDLQVTSIGVVRMPKQTFYNLSEDKRKTLENVAIDEFADNGFDKASINTIVEKSGISKGEFLSIL